MRCRLANQLGKYLWEIDRDMSCYEFAVRQAHFEIEPYGSVFDDLLNARLCAVVYNTSTGFSYAKGAQPKSAIDYMYNTEAQEKRFPTPKELQNKMLAQFKQVTQHLKRG